MCDKLVRDNVVCGREVCVCVRDNVVCEREVCERAVCDKVLCERMKSCVQLVFEKEAFVCVCVRERVVRDKDVCVCERVSCDKVVCLCVGKLYVKECCVCVCVCAETQEPRGCHQVPRMPYRVSVDGTNSHTCHAKERRRHTDQGTLPEPGQCRKCHACHSKCRGAAGDHADARGHQGQPNTVSATPATQKGSQCHQVPHLPRIYIMLYI